MNSIKPSIISKKNIALIVLPLMFSSCTHLTDKLFPGILNNKPDPQIIKTDERKDYDLYPQKSKYDNLTPCIVIYETEL